ncbi:MAG: restriction endonuclease [Anaerolineales bacterium]|nr:restriction endonuclease [Anaerolineales bacterium]MCW5856062.1 restriction endonuclease [Anaerolineales bacterium]
MWKEEATRKIHRLSQVSFVSGLLSIALLLSLCSTLTSDWRGIIFLALISVVLIAFVTHSISKDMAKEEELLLLTPPVSVKDLKRIREILSSIQSERPKFEKQLADAKIALATKINSIAYSPNKETRILPQDIHAVELIEYSEMYQNTLVRIKVKAEQAVREILIVFNIMPPGLEVREFHTIEVQQTKITIKTSKGMFEFPIIASKSPQAQDAIEVLNFLSILFTEYAGPSQSELDKIDKLSGIEFEKYIIGVLKEHGYAVSLSGKSGDLGVDILAEKNDIKYAIQCKRQGSMVSRRAVSDAVAGMQHYNCDQAVVITNNRFSPGAKQLAKSNDCILIDREMLSKILSIESGKSQDVVGQVAKQT